MILECEWRHARKREFGDFEKGEASLAGGYGMRGAFVGSVSWDLTLGEASPAGGYEMRGAFVGSVSWDLTQGLATQQGVGCGRCGNCQHSKNCVSLSSFRKTKTQEVNKCFVPELLRVVSVSGFPCTRIYYTSTKAKKRTCRIVDFAVLANHKVKIKEGEKRNECFDLAKELKKTMEHEGDCYNSCNWCTWNDPQRVSKGTRRLGNQRTRRDHPDNCIIKIGQNTEKSPEYLRGLAVTQSLVKIII